MTPIQWKKGRGKLGIFQPLLGRWRTEADTDMGHIVIERTLSKTLNDKYIQVSVKWFLSDSTYEEHALIGVNVDKEINFWSFTNDGKQSQGYLVDATDLHPEAIGFEAHMPAGLARMAYWPDEKEGYRWIVQNKTKKGWNDILVHHYVRMEN